MCIFPGKHGRQPAHFHLRNFRWRVYDADQWRITVWLHRGQIWTQKCVISFNFIDGYRNNKYGMPANLCNGGLRSPHHVVLSSSLPRSIGRRPGLFYARLHEEGKRQVSVKNNVACIIFRFIVWQLVGTFVISIENAPPGQEGYYGAIGRSNVSGSVECSHTLVHHVSHPICLFQS